MGKENSVYMHSGARFSHKEENHVICKKLDANGNPSVKQSKPDHFPSQNVHLKKLRQRKRLREEGANMSKIYCVQYENAILELKVYSELSASNS